MKCQMYTSYTLIWRGENSFLHLLLPSFCPSPHTWVVYQRSQSCQKQGDLYRCCFLARKMEISRDKSRTCGNLFFCRKIRCCKPRWLKFKNSVCGHHVKSSLLLYFGVMDRWYKHSENQLTVFFSNFLFDLNHELHLRGMWTWPYHVFSCWGPPWPSCLKLLPTLQATLPTLLQSFILSQYTTI